ncbi:hypothetical protein Q4603_07115 [Zobellia galactanivorans]|uniref:Conserved hypothetical membrane protein n=1 Tax=Zobellia galactanivorans (strain DSM 12802 / CCUG 47099 / CIP 106680 / NCIMB 13871 / Dsij) TaxID=63186 RepID=G0L3S8_ZOBGA|nr:MULTISPECIES: hypothetical protein [Zobellia]MBU3028090.1 hypothetical protein [Zobellia galactanivorans]MDO6808371.1 hypothetical protein [Zobellia galactanivorans]OWW26490.1 hypothetical protein B4Q04_02050 [Zobellia sp. OII3]CAZ95437.1 Conserved hypothetical membrane protein [Zobellia galactanivorans]
MELGFEMMTLFEKIYWVTAITASIILIILLIMTFIGGEIDDIEGDVDVEIEGDTGIEFQFLSFKNLVGFFTIFGWSGIACLDAGVAKGLTVVISVICGLLMMLAMASLFYYLGKLQSSGTLKLKNALNQIGEVYLTIGANRKSIGKVSINVQGTLRELEALTNADKDLVQGDVVVVKEVTANGILIVEPINN